MTFLPTSNSSFLIPASSKESIAEEKYKSEKEKGHEKIHRKGRFSVVTDEGPDVRPLNFSTFKLNRFVKLPPYLSGCSSAQKDCPAIRKGKVVEVIQLSFLLLSLTYPTIILVLFQIHSQPATPGSGGEKGHVTATSLLPHIQTLMKHTTEQQVNFLFFYYGVFELFSHPYFFFQEALYQLVSILMPSEGKFEFMFAINWLFFSKSVAHLSTLFVQSLGRGIFSRSSSEEGVRFFSFFCSFVFFS